MPELSYSSVFNRLYRTSEPQNQAVARPLAEDRTPFQIRGHHIDWFLLMVGNRMPPDLLARRLVEEYEKKLKRPKYQRDIFAIDTIGESSQLKQFGSNSQELFERFEQLPDNHPIELLEGMKDDFCKRCVTGAGVHCNLYSMSGPDYMDSISGDGRYLDWFLKRAQKLNLEDNVSVSTRTARFFDADSAQARVLNTDASTFRNILTHWIFN